jgi:hypothetical protein
LAASILQEAFGRVPRRRHILREKESGLGGSIVLNGEQCLSGKLQDIAADVLAYALMTVLTPLIIGLAYVTMRGMKPGRRWLFHLLRVWMDICASPFFKFRRSLSDKQNLPVGLSNG